MTAHPAARIALHRIVLGLAVLLGGLVLLAPSRTGLATLLGEGSSFDTRMISDVQVTDPDANPTTPHLPAAPGVSDAWWSRTQADLARAEYGATLTSAGLQAPNRAHNLRTTFAEHGIAVVPRTTSEVALESHFAWETTGIGRSGRMEEASRVSPEAEGSRVTYRRDGWSEWYENSAKGLEQGFTIERRPSGEGPLRIAGRFPEGLRAEVQSDGAIDFLDAHGARVIRYGELHVWDARSAEIHAELAVAGTSLSIVINDGDANYPLIVDPLLSSPSWTAESDQESASFGVSVSTAGDVNGDGFSDVVVGAFRYDNGHAEEGRAFLYLGSASGLSATPSWNAEGDQDGANFGRVVATAGDVNGDGFADVIVGANSFDNEQPNEGRAFVYHGSASGLSATPNWIEEGNQDGAHFGRPVATAGDVNGDGFSDVIVGAFVFDNGQSNEGRAFVYHGSASGLSATPAWTAESDQDGAFFGIAVATAGDVNGDGFSDVAVGAGFYDNGQPDEGRVFVYHGSASGLSASANWTAEANQTSALFGESAGTAGDVNGDGFSDLIVGVTLLGRAYVYHGSAAGLSVTPNWTALGNQPGAFFGVAAATAGDVNGDGFADVVVGAPLFTNGHLDEGRAFVYHGSAGGLNLAPNWTGESDQNSAGFGTAVSTAGDVNGDGFSDLIVGAKSFDNGQNDEGRAFVYLGSPGSIATTATWTDEGFQESEYFGFSVGTAGDVNGDGYSDVIVGAYGHSNGHSREGRALVYLGSPEGLATAPAWTAEGNEPSANFGVSVGTAGDVNGDGYSDVIIGAHRYHQRGKVFVFHGSPTGLATLPAWTAESDKQGTQFGYSVGTAGDVNGDSYSDVVVGAADYNNGHIAEGKAFVYHGSAGGLSSSPAWTAEGNQSGAAFGFSAATAGDVNGDGFSDLVVGAFLYDLGEIDSGAAFVYHGSAAGLGTNPAWTEGPGAPTGSGFGVSVATAGDMNGDGFSDVVVGAFQWNNGQIDEGRIFIYKGSASGLTLNHSWTAEGDQESALFGYPVGTAGDVNGDGYSDLIVGASGYSNGQHAEGRAYVFHGRPDGPAVKADWAVESNDQFARFGVGSGAAGDVNGDGFGDVIVGASEYRNQVVAQGAAFAYYGNGGSGRPTHLRQQRTDGTTSIAPLGRSDSDTHFRIRATIPSIYGRTRLQIEHEVKPLGEPLDGLNTLTGDYVDVGDDGEVELDRLVSALSPDTPYHWRVRTKYDLAKSPFQRNGPWMHIPLNGRNETDLRTAGAQTGIEIASAPPASILLGSPRPNPLGASTTIGYALPRKGRVHLAVYDATGRACMVLVDAVQLAGRRVATWDGRDARGTQLPAGVYFVRLAFDQQMETQKIVLVR